MYVVLGDPKNWMRRLICNYGLSYYACASTFIFSLVSFVGSSGAYPNSISVSFSLHATPSTVPSWQWMGCHDQSMYGHVLSRYQQRLLGPTLFAIFLSSVLDAALGGGFFQVMLILVRFDFAHHLQRVFVILNRCWSFGMRNAPLLAHKLGMD
jgi:hypothetical protein